VTIIVPFIAGGNTDMMARLAAERLSAKFGQPFVIENRGGAGGITGAAQVARSAPDGYTFLFGAGSQLVLAPLLQKVGYDPDKDLIPITEFGTGPQILGVKGDMPVNTLQEFIDYAKARPGKLTYAGVGIQTVTAIAAGVLIARTGLEMTLVPYKGGVQAVGDLLAGHVDMYFGNASEMLPQPRVGFRRHPTCRRWPRRSPAFSSDRGTASWRRRGHRKRSSTSWSRARSRR
jgi:tripartite-type tricarboxylate transporter receptor subunit TctC